MMKVIYKIKYNSEIHFYIISNNKKIKIFSNKFHVQYDDLVV